MDRNEVTWKRLRQLLRSLAGKQTFGEIYRERLEFEIDEIEKQGAESYWLNLFKADKKFSNNPNSLIIPFLLGMIDQDPIVGRKDEILCSTRARDVRDYITRHGKAPSDIARDSDMPDIDLDCLPSARDPLKEYAATRYGNSTSDGIGSVCSVGTWQTYKFKSALIDVAVALRHKNRYEVEEYTKEFPQDADELREGGLSACKCRVINEVGEEKECGVIHDKDKCPSCGGEDTEYPTLGKLLAEIPKLAELYTNDAELVHYASMLVGRVRNMGMHAGALIITDRPLFGNIPLSKSGSKGYWTSLWTEGRSTQLSKFGYVKWDVLGLKTLEYIYNCCKMIEANRGISFGENFSGLDEIDPELNQAGAFYDGQRNKQVIRLDDAHALSLANQQKTDGIFQFDTDLAKSILKNGVKNFGDLMLLNAMGHPGPMQSIPEVVANRDDPKQSWRNRLHPDFLKVLGDTYGCIVYQEQLQQLWQNIAGFTAPEAQEARKAVAKKWTAKLKPIKEKWIEGASKILGKAEAEQWWSKQETFGRYAFNRSHAVAYCLVAFRCLWLKAHFAPEWWAAVMSDCHPDKLVRYMGVARGESWKPTEITNCGTKVAEHDALVFDTIDINNLTTSFAVSGNRIMQGIVSIKGIGERAASLYGGTNDCKTIDEFLAIEGRKNKTALERFIKLGAFKNLPLHNHGKALWYYYIFHYTTDSKLKKQVKQDLLVCQNWNEQTIKDEQLRQIKEYRKLYPKRIRVPDKLMKWQPTAKTGLAEFHACYGDFTVEEKLEYQKQYLGFFVDSPLAVYRVTGTKTIAAAKKRGEGVKSQLEVILNNVTDAISKNDKPYKKLSITDGISTSTVMVWARECTIQRPKCLETGHGIKLIVNFDPERHIFVLDRGYQIERLVKIDEEERGR